MGSFREGLKKPSYIFGTLHNLCYNEKVLSAEMITIISRCDLICFEINLDDAKQWNPADWYMKDNQLLSSLISDTDYKAVVAYFKVHNYPLTTEQINKMEPGTLLLTAERLNLPCNNIIGVEQMLINEGKLLRKRFMGLESNIDQAAIIANIPYSKQARHLAEYMHKISENQQMTLSFKLLYFAQDLNAMDSFVNKGQMTKEDYKIIAVDRNKKWMGIIKKAIYHNSILFAVGTAHLLGHDGILAMLRRQGYSAIPVRINPFALP